MSGFGLAVLKQEGCAGVFETGEVVGDSEYKPSETEWVEMCYDPADKVEEGLFTTLTQLIDSRLVAFEGLSKEDMQAVIRKLAYTYHKSESGL